VLPGPPPTIREMDEAIAEHVAEMDRRTLSDYQSEDGDDA